MRTVWTPGRRLCPHPPPITQEQGVCKASSSFHDDPPGAASNLRLTDPEGVSEREPWGLRDPCLTGGGRAASVGLYLFLFSVLLARLFTHRPQDTTWSFFLTSIPLHRQLYGKCGKGQNSFLITLLEFEERRKEGDVTEPSM